MITPIIMESEMQEVMRKYARLGNSPRIHFDVGDGLFSDLLTVAPADLQALDLTQRAVDLHLLVDDPTEWIEESVALSPARLIGQIEHMGSQTAYLSAVSEYGALAGLGLAIDTPVEALEQDALAKTAVVLLLAVPAGTSGSPFDQRVLAKIHELRARYAGPILIDGGITPTTYEMVITAGATEAAANSSWWKGLWQKTGK